MERKENVSKKSSRKGKLLTWLITIVYFIVSIVLIWFISRKFNLAMLPRSILMGMNSGLIVTLYPILKKKLKK